MSLIVDHSGTFSRGRKKEAESEGEPKKKNPTHGTLIRVPQREGAIRSKKGKTGRVVHLVPASRLEAGKSSEMENKPCQDSEGY